MSEQEIDEGLAERRAEVELLMGMLAEQILVCCPGPHETVQHRDMRPRWCDACGRDGMGRRHGLTPTEREADRNAAESRAGGAR